jgi:hypothetical protein
MRRPEENPVRGADDIGRAAGHDGERTGQPHGGAAQLDERTTMKALLVAIEVGAILGIVAAVLTAHFVTVW